MKRPADRCYRVTILRRGVCCRIHVRGDGPGWGKVTDDTAPIFRWAYGKDWYTVWNWILKQGGFIEAMDVAAVTP